MELQESVAAQRGAITEKCHRESVDGIGAQDFTVSIQMSEVKTPEYGVGSFTLCRPWPCADVLGEVFRGIFIPPVLFPSCVGFH